MKARRNEDLPREGQGRAAKVKAIARKSAELFSGRGFAETSMEDIAAGTRLAKGGVYHYFRTKADILYFVCSTSADLILGDLERAAIGPDGTGERLRRIIFHLVRHHVENAQGAKTLIYESRKLPPRSLRLIRTKERRCREIVSGAIGDLLGPYAREEVTATLTRTLFGMTGWICSDYDPKDAVSPEELSELIFGLFTRGACGLNPALPAPRRKASV